MAEENVVKNYALKCECGSVDFVKSMKCHMQEVTSGDESAQSLCVIEAYTYTCASCTRKSDFYYNSRALVGVNNNPKGEQNYNMLKGLITDGSFVEA